MFNLKISKKNKIKKESDVPEQPKKKLKPNLVLLLIILLGLILRLTGIQHGFPFIFHPDEPTIIRSALGIRFDPNPKHFDWPHLYIYINYFLYMLFAKFRSLLEAANLKNTLSSVFPLIWNDDLIFYYLTRCLSAILGALTAIPLYLTSKNLFGKKAGILTALAITIMPYHVWHSHYSLGDIPAAFLVSWALYYSSLIIKSSDKKNYILAGLFIGLSASIKYNGGLTALMVPVAHFLRIFWTNKNEDKIKNFQRIFLGSADIKKLIFSGLLAFLGFLIGTPFALLDFKTFSRTDGPQGAFWQFTNVGSVNSSQHFDKFLSESFGRLLVDTGYVVMTLFFIGLFYVLFRLIRKKTDEKDIYLSFIYIVSLFLIWYLAGFKNNRSHYYFIVYPFLAVIVGYFASWLSEEGWKEDFKLEFKGLIKTVVSAIPVLLFLPPFMMSVNNAKRYYMNDTRTWLYRWLSENRESGEAAVFNDSTLRAVFKYLGMQSTKSLDNFKMYKKTLVVIYEPGDREKAFLEKYSSDLEKVAEFDGKGRLGSDIEVYRYSSPVGDNINNSGCGCSQ